MELCAGGRGCQSYGLMVFDLDGTLVDSRQDLAGSVNAVRRHFGLGPLTDGIVGALIGDGPEQLMARALNLPANSPDVLEGLDIFLTHYREHLLDTSVVYPGVAETLQELLDSGVRMAVFTNKPARLSSALLEGLGLGRYFLHVCGGNTFERRKPDPEGLHALVRSSGVGASATLMVGDSATDVRTGRAAGVRTCGVGYGYASASFAEASPDYRIERFRELLFLTR